MFTPAGKEKQLRIFKPFLAYVIRTVRPNDMPEMVENGSQEAPPRNIVVKYNTFVTFVLLFSVSPPRAKVVILNRFARLMARTTCSVLYTCLLGVWTFEIHF